MIIADTHFILNQSRDVSSVIIGIRQYIRQQNISITICNGNLKKPAILLKQNRDFLNGKVRDYTK